MKLVRYVALSAFAGLLALVSLTGSHSPSTVRTNGPSESATTTSPQSGGSWNSPGLGGAGAFIPPAHVNGPFGAGGPCAGLGGAGAFIPSTLPAVCSGR